MADFLITIPDTLIAQAPAENPVTVERLTAVCLANVRATVLNTFAEDAQRGADEAIDAKREALQREGVRAAVEPL